MPPSSPEDSQHIQIIDGHEPDFESDGIHPYPQDQALVHSDAEATHVQGDIEEPHQPPNARTRLLENERKYHFSECAGCGEENCSHGTFSPRPRYQRGYGSFATNNTFGSDGSREGYGGPNPYGSGHETSANGRHYRGDYVEGALGDAVTDGLLGRQSKQSTTHWLAKRHGVKNERLMYGHSLFFTLSSTSLASSHLPSCL